MKKSEPATTTRSTIARIAKVRRPGRRVDIDASVGVDWPERPPRLRSNVGSEAPPSWAQQPTLARLAQRTCSGSARERSQIRLRNQTGVESAGHTPQVFDLIWRQHVEDEPSNLPEVNRTRLHQLPVALVRQLGVRRVALGPAHSAHPPLPLEARDHV